MNTGDFLWGQSFPGHEHITGDFLPETFSPGWKCEAEEVG